ncbi:MAG: GNAT family N-acetyltransferase [Candidatus Eisenbacteria bacterium]|nr:GNAT family N-acetyltransferase [Candidatus Eisenbacteria bacterium]
MDPLTAELANVERALEQNLWALWMRFGRGAGCVLHNEPDALWFETPIPTLPYNAVLRHTSEYGVDRSIDRIFETYRVRGVPFVWLIHPSAAPADLAAKLRARGLVEVETVEGMWLDLSLLSPVPPPPAGIQIREVETDADREAFIDLVAWRWEVPGEFVPTLREISGSFGIGAPGSSIRGWIAWKDGLPVSKVLLNQAAGAAGIYAVATRPEARGQGLARRLTLAALDAARENGHQLAVLHATPMSVDLYAKLGFRSFAPFHVYAQPGNFHL